MPGPPAKHPSVRARRNKTSTAATLRRDVSIDAPNLPAGYDWHPMTVAWWADVWASPMAPEFDASDRHGIFKLAMLQQDFWTAESARDRKEAAAEIRLQEQRFGLSPMDRRRLQWEIERTEDAKARGERRRGSVGQPPATPGKDGPGGDPRGGLYAVS